MAIAIIAICVSFGSAILSTLVFRHCKKAIGIIYKFFFHLSVWGLGFIRGLLLEESLFGAVLFQYLVRSRYVGSHHHNFVV
jgi:hypothetical protein